MGLDGKTAQLEDSIDVLNPVWDISGRRRQGTSLVD